MPRHATAGAFCLAVLSMFLFTMNSVDATTLRRMQFPEVVTRAERIVHARVVDQNVHWDASGRRIYTDTTFQVLEEIKGRGPQRLTVSLLGGRISPVVMIVEGSPRFRLGQEFILFTTPRPDGKVNLVGFGQAIVRIVADPASGKKLAVGMPLRGVTFADTDRRRPERVHSNRNRVPLEMFLEQLRRTLETVLDEGTSVGLEPLREESRGSRRQP